MSKVLEVGGFPDEGASHVKGIMHTISTSNVDDSILLLMIFCCWLISLPIRSG